MSARKRKKRKPATEAAETLPRFAKNKAELARILIVDRKTILRYSKNPHAPKPRSNGNLEIEAWRGFLREQGVLEDDDDLLALKKKDLREVTAIRAIRKREMLGELVSAEEVQREVGQAAMAAKAVLLAGPPSLAPQVVGVSIPEAEEILRVWLHDALAKLCLNPLGRNTEETA